MTKPGQWFALRENKCVLETNGPPLRNHSESLKARTLPHHSPFSCFSIPPSPSPSPSNKNQDQTEMTLKRIRLGGESGIRPWFCRVRPPASPSSYFPKCHRTSFQNSSYQIRHAGSRTIGWPALQPNASWNAAEFWTTPLTRERPGECRSVMVHTSVSD